jgi:hypothetical protein
MNSPEFLSRFRQYIDLGQTRRFKPNFTVMTADKDDPRFDGFYQNGNIVRYFIALFLSELPSYVGLGFEVRNRHEERGANEEYSKLYVFQIHDEADIDKVTRGPFQWGQNIEQFRTILQLRFLADQLGSAVLDQPVLWLIPPDSTGFQSAIAWTQRNNPAYVFACNLNQEEPVRHLSLPLLSDPSKRLEWVFDTTDENDSQTLNNNGYHFPLPQLNPGCCRVYKVI